MNQHLQHQNIAENQAQNMCSQETVRCAFHPQYRRVIENAEGHGVSVSDCGDSTEIFVSIEDGIIIDAGFVTTGCFGQVAAAEKLCESVINKTIAEALSITGEEIDEALGHLPEEVSHCTQDACDTLATAVRNYLTNKSAPWRQIYG